MEVRPGYKQTEVGVVPEEWDVKQLRDIAKIATGSTPPTSDAANYGDEFMFVSPADMGDTKLITHTEKRLSRKGFSVSRWFPKDSVLFVCIGSTIGKCGMASTVLTSNQQINAIYPSKAFCADYIYYSVSVAAPRVRALAGEQAVPLVNKSQFSDTRIALPPVAEQRAIADALSDVDALLGGLDRLIAKKRDLKQAAMQQLLTGQTRLPGFHGEWEVASLDMITFRATGVWGKNKPDDRSSRLVEIIRAGDITQDGKLAATATRYVAPEEFEKAQCALDDLVITTSGNGLGKLWWCDGRGNVAASNFVRVLHPKTANVVGRFLYYALRTGEGLRQLQEHTATSAYPNLRPTYFSTAWILLPRLPEQTAIAAVLSDMDGELSTLEARRDKTRDLKQAMMQELLTGRTRLV